MAQEAPDVDSPLQTACYILSLHVFCTQMQVLESLQAWKDKRRDIEKVCVVAGQQMCELLSL